MPLPGCCTGSKQQASQQSQGACWQMTRASARLSPPLLFFLATRLHRFAIALLFGLPLLFCLATRLHRFAIALLLTTHLMSFAIALLLVHPVEQVCHCPSALPLACTNLPLLLGYPPAKVYHCSSSRFAIVLLLGHQPAQLYHCSSA